MSALMSRLYNVLCMRAWCVCLCKVVCQGGVQNWWQIIIKTIYNLLAKHQM